MPQPFVSVIVLGWGGERYVATCLSALCCQTYRDFEVIVVDNGSPDRTVEIVERDFPQVKLIRTGKNLGVAGGNNAGLRAAKGDILILTNVDTEACPDWIENLVRAMGADSMIGVAGSKLLYPDGSVQFGGGRIDPVQGFGSHADWHAADRPNDREVRETDFATGASLAVRREVLEQIGLEDDAYFPIDYEDSDLCYRARLAGWRICYVPGAVSVHHESSTLEPMAPHRVLSSQMGRLRFVSKYWADEDLQGSFYTKEKQWLQELRRVPDKVAPFLCEAMPLVYFKNLLDIDDLVGWRERLGVSPREEARGTLTEVLTGLRAVGLLNASPLTIEMLDPTSRAVADVLQHWLPGHREDVSASLLLALQASKVQVNPHLPIAWPHWPPGVWPKVKAALQKVARRLLRWYIDPLIAQQNDINADLLQSLYGMSQEVILLRRQLAHSEEELRAEIQALSRQIEGQSTG